MEAQNWLSCLGPLKTLPLQLHMFSSHKRINLTSSSFITNVTPNKEIALAHLRPILNVIKDPFTTPEKLQAYGAMSMVSYEQAPHAKGTMRFESVQLKLLKRAKSFVAQVALHSFTGR